MTSLIASTYQIAHIDFFKNIYDKLITGIKSNIKYNGKKYKGGQLFLVYQPIIETNTYTTISLEALLRWKHPRKGIIGALEFVPNIEKDGSIVQIGEWVLKQSCKQIKEWHNKGFKEISISVNISPAQLQQHDFSQMVEKILKNNNVDAKYLCLEITERCLLGMSCIIQKNIDHLKGMGVKIIIDDFGIGNNTFKNLIDYQFDGLKIDRSFIRHIDLDTNQAIVDTILALADRLDLTITAEGVETSEQLEYLVLGKCPRVQGYYFCKPLEAKKVEHFLKGR